jgi:hypothetical protein
MRFPPDVEPCIPLPLHVTAIALTFLDLGFRLSFPIGRKRAAHFHFFLELAFLIPADITPVAFFGLNHRALARFAFLFSRHFLLLFAVTSRAGAVPVGFLRRIDSSGASLKIIHSKDSLRSCE